MVRSNQVSKLVRIVVCTLLLVCGAYSFAQDQSQQTGNQPPGTCPTAFPTCIFYGGPSDWNHTPTKGYLPILGPAPYGPSVYDNAIFSTTQTINGIFINALVNPSELSLYTYGYWEIRVGVSEFNQGVLIAAGFCTGTDFQAIPNGENLGANMGVWFGCNMNGFTVSPGLYWFTLEPQATGAIKPLFEWATSSPAPYVGVNRPSCDTYPAPSCAYYAATTPPYMYVNTADGAGVLPYSGPFTRGLWSWGLY